MPRTQRQTRGEIIASLQGKALISPQDLEDALAAAGIESPKAVAYYTKKLEAEHMVRVSGGWELTKEAKQTGIITIKVTPKMNTGDVIRGLNQVLPAFGKTVTLEVEA
jgi:hypothetical protein